MMQYNNNQFINELNEAIGCNVNPGEHPECDVSLQDVLTVCRKFYGFIPGEDRPPLREQIAKLLCKRQMLEYNNDMLEDADAVMELINNHWKNNDAKK